MARMFGSASSGWHCDSWKPPHFNMFMPGQKVLMLGQLKKLLLYFTISRSMRYFTQSSCMYLIQKFMVAWIIAFVWMWEINKQMLMWYIFKLCWCRVQALPSESCLRISWPEQLVSQERIQMMKTMRSLRRCWSKPRALRSELHTHTHLLWEPVTWSFPILTPFLAGHLHGYINTKNILY